jgi:flagellar FliL protein
MARLLPIILVLIAVCGGGGAALFLKRNASPAAAAAEETPVETVKEEKKKADEVGYMRFQRAFIVPVVEEGGLSSLVLLDLSLEMEKDAAEKARAKEPKLRDVFMRTLIGLSHDGVFAGDITDPQSYEEVRRRLNEAATDTLGESVLSVLIVDYARQER